MKSKGLTTSVNPTSEPPPHDPSYPDFVTMEQPQKPFYKVKIVPQMVIGERP